MRRYFAAALPLAMIVGALGAFQVRSTTAYFSGVAFNSFSIATAPSTNAVPTACIAVVGTNYEVIVLTEGDDTWPAPADDKNISNGNQVIFGLGGNDTIDAGNGNDCIIGGEGNDVLDGGSAKDYLAGGVGNDTLNGDNGKDIMDGGDGTDTCNGGNAPDKSNCELPAASPHTLSGPNTLAVPGSADGPPTDVTAPETGDDGAVTVAQHPIPAQCQGPEWTDATVIVLDGSGDAYHAPDNGAHIIFVGKEARDVYGGAGRDCIVLGDSDGYADGGAGADVVIAGDGAAKLFGGAGDDTLIAGSAVSFMDGGVGVNVCSTSNPEVIMQNCSAPPAGTGVSKPNKAAATATAEPASTPTPTPTPRPKNAPHADFNGVAIAPDD